MATIENNVNNLLQNEFELFKGGSADYNNAFNQYIGQNSNLTKVNMINLDLGPTVNERNQNSIKRKSKQTNTSTNIYMINLPQINIQNFKQSINYQSNEIDERKNILQTRQGGSSSLRDRGVNVLKNAGEIISGGHGLNTGLSNNNRAMNVVDFNMVINELNIGSSSSML